MDQTGRAKLPRNTIKVHSALGTRQETQQHAAEPAVCHESVQQGSCWAEIFAPPDRRTNHTRRRALRPPCLPPGDQRFCAPQSRQAGIVALRRVLWRLRCLGTYHVSCGLGTGSGSRCALRRSGQTCALLAGWPGALATAGAKVALARVFSQSPLHAQGSKSSQCPNAVSQNQRERSSEACT